MPVVLHQKQPDTATPIMPPRGTNWCGQPRQVGVEIEFGGVNLNSLAHKISERLGGHSVSHGEHRVKIFSTSLGDLTIELDSRFAHANSEHLQATEGLTGEVMRRAAPSLGHVIKHFLPHEIICPPVAVAELKALEELLSLLDEFAAEGTNHRAIDAFGLHLNPDLPDLKSGTILRYFRAYLVLDGWLRGEIGVASSRRILGYVKPFSDRMVRHFLAPTYDPCQQALITDYLKYCTDRDVGLDLLPLLKHLAPMAVANAVEGTLVKPRPTFHYRLPDSRVGEHGWGGITLEWNRWVLVEMLAEQPALLSKAGSQLSAFLEAGGAYKDWAPQSYGWAHHIQMMA